MAEDLLITEVEGPLGTAEIFEVTLPTKDIAEVDYVVVFAGERRSVPSLGEAHLLANEMTGVDADRLDC